jgi:hypothetical protein
MRLTYWLSDVNWRASDPLHDHFSDEGFDLSGFVRPSRYLKFQDGSIRWQGIDHWYSMMDRMIAGDLPLVVDLEKNTWITQPGSGPITPEQWYKNRRDVSVYMRAKWPHRLITNYAQPSNVDNEILHRLGCAWTCGSVSMYRREGWNEQHWQNIVRDRYENALKWDMPISVYFAPAMWGNGANRNERLANTRTPTGAEYAAMLDMVEELNPDFLLFWQNHPNDAFTDDNIKTWSTLVSQRFNGEPMEDDDDDE